MEIEEMSRMPILPEDLVEMILGMVPFPSIFKARALSKSWLARLSPVSSQDDDQATSSLAISFQRRMGEYWTAKWIFCPVLLHEEDFVVYNPRSHRWEWIPLLSFLPENCIKSGFLQLEGPLLITVPLKHWCNLLVANVLTRTSRLLPPRPWVQESYSCSETITVMHKETYRVIALYHRKFGLSCALIYDSNVDAWRKKRFDEVPQGFKIHSAGKCINGVVYWLVGPEEDIRGLLLFKVEEETFLFLEMPSTDASSFLKVCAGRLFMAHSYKHEGRLRVTVKTVDIESRNWLEVTRGPPEAACDCRLSSLVHHVINPDCLFFMVGKRGDYDAYSLVYSVQNNRWSYLALPPKEDISGSFVSSFQPGINPFMRP